VSPVVDASVLVAATSDSGPDGAWAEEIIASDRLVAPYLVVVEATNILRRLELAKRLTALEAGTAQRDLLRLDLELAPYHPFSERIWALRTNLTSYDAWYVAVAEALALPLATLDRRLARSRGPRCRFLLSS
jgi:predicted nucleic acid-binding protein